MRQIILDTETTGLSPKEGHRIIEVGCLEIINRRPTGNNLHFYINPQRAIERAAAEVHGITEAFLRDKPVFIDIVDQLIEYLNGAELIIHNAPFDVAFLNHELNLAKKKYREITHYCKVTDSLALARKIHPGQQNSLDALCRRYQVDNSNRDLHGALLDAGLLAQVYLLMTGGQTELFAAEANQASVSKAAIKIRRLPVERSTLPIVPASAEELASHENFMQQVLGHKNDAKKQ